MSSDQLWASSASQWGGTIPYIDPRPPLLDNRASNADNAAIMGRWMSNTFDETAKRLAYAISTKGYWITYPPVNGYYLFAAMQTFNRALNDFIVALNRIPNTEPRAGGNMAGRGGDNSDDTIQIDNVQDLISFVKALSKASDIGEVEPPADKSQALEGATPPAPSTSLTEQAQ